MRVGTKGFFCFTEKVSDVDIQSRIRIQRPKKSPITNSHPNPPTHWIFQNLLSPY